MKTLCNNKYLNYGRYLIIFQLIFVAIRGLLIDFGFPHSITYITDIVNILILFCILLSQSITCLRRYCPVFFSMLIWYIYMLTASFLKAGSVLRIAWATRNWCRFFVFFAGVLLFFRTKESILWIIRSVKIFFWLNFALCIFEFFVLGLKEDYLSGFFGSEFGGNGYLNILFCIVIILYYTEWYYSDAYHYKYSLASLAVMILSGLSQLKVFYYEYLMIAAAFVILALFQKKKSIKYYLYLLITAFVSIVTGLIVLYFICPSHLLVMLHMHILSTYETTVTDSYYLGRTTAFRKINELFFGDSLLLKLTGFGLGNCEYSSYSFLTSAFYQQYGYMNYNWFTHQILYLEGGLIGVVLFAGIFIVMLVQSVLSFFRGKKDSAFAVMGILFSSITIINLIYNNAIRAEAGYITYFFLALCLIGDSVMQGKTKVPEAEAVRRE